MTVSYRFEVEDIIEMSNLLGSSGSTIKSSMTVFTLGNLAVNIVM